MQPENKLRLFADLDDLFDSVDDTLILKWVNELATLKEKTRYYGAKHRAKKAIFVQVAKEMLAPDELERVERLAQERLEEEGK